MKCALLKLFTLGVLTTALVHFCTQVTPVSGAMPAGDIVAVVSYLLLYTSTVGLLPSVCRGT